MRRWLAFVALAFIAAPALAEDRVQVSLSVDITAGAAVGMAEYPDGRSQELRIELPALDRAPDPFQGYIGPDDALLPAGSGWLPPLDGGAVGWTVTVTASPGFLAVPYSDGAVETGADGRVSSVMRIDTVAARGPLVVGRFEMAERQAGPVTIRTFFTSKNARHSPAYLDAAAEAVAVLTERIGEYPYGAFAVVESPLPVGLGFPGYTLVSGRILGLPFMRGRSLWHEVSHVWWGNAVLVDYESGNWAEGFATFFADYALAERRGPEAAREMRYDWLLDFDALKPADDLPLRQFVAKSHGQAQALGYGKAAMVLHMLRRKIGDEAFDAGVRAFWQANKFRRAGWTDVEKAFASVTDVDLASFFSRWIEEPGAEPADPSDRDFHMFRALAPEERIAIFRAAFAGRAYVLKPLAGAPGDAGALAEALAPLGRIGDAGTPIYVGDRAALGKIFAELPPDASEIAIWAGADPNGDIALGLLASDLGAVSMLAGRSRHYGKWSWLTVGPDGRPRRGRWERR